MSRQSKIGSGEIFDDEGEVSCFKLSPGKLALRGDALG